jgi:hypothetical protein
MRTVTVVVSVAVPVNDGVVLFDSGLASAFNVTFGDSVSTMKVTGALVPGELPIALVWVAVAVYVPRVRAGAAGFDAHEPPAPSAKAVARTGPVAVFPA